VTLTGDIDIDRSNVYMQCIGKNTTITLANATNTHMVSLNGYDNVTIDGCTFDGNKANQTTGGTVIQVDTGVTDFTFKNNTVHDSYNNGVYANTTSRIKVVDNYFYDIGKTGVSPHSGGFAVEVYGTSTDIEVSRNTITNALGDGSIFIYGTDTSNRNKYVVLKDNHISGIDDGDEKCCIQNVFSDYMTMSGNICHDNINDGTSPDNGNNGLCSFNSDNVTVSNNVVYNVDGTGIEVYGTDMVVSGNTIDLCGFEQGYAGIYMGGTVGSVTGNKINNCNVGVQLEGTDHVVASGNFINNDTATTNQATKVIANAGQTVTDTMMVDNSIYAGTSSMDPAQIVLELSTGTLTGVILRNRVNGAYADAFSSYSDATIANSDIVLDDGLNNGWTIKSAANTACSTTCVYGCNYGYDSGTNLPVACSNATADACYCKNGE
jgi:parallel beta-helix repeat protein